MVKKRNIITYPYEKRLVFYAALRTINAHKKMKLKSSDEIAGYISLSLGMSMFSWGEQVSITIRRIDDSNSDMLVESASNYALIDYGKNQKNIDELVKGISEELRRDPHS